MEKIKYKFLNAALGAASGLTGIMSLSWCSGKTCASCYGCAGAGIGLLLIALLNKFKKAKSLEGAEKWN